MLLITHPTGNVFVRALLEALEQEEADYLFFTSLAVSSEAWWLTLLPSEARAEVRRRAYPIPAARWRQRPWPELGRLAANVCGTSSFRGRFNRWFSVDQVYRDLDGYVASELKKTLARQ